MQSNDPHEMPGRARPRGSRSGLKARQAESVARTSEALSKTLGGLLASQSDRRISERALCLSAGLKSTVALHSPANADCLRKLREHNSSIREQEVPATSQSVGGDEKDKLILRQDAEISTLLRENQRLRRQIKALRERLVKDS